MHVDKAVAAKLATMPLPVSDDEHNKNAQVAASYAVDHASYKFWATDGADEDDEQEIEVVAVGYLPNTEFDLLASIDAPAAGVEDPRERRHRRIECATRVDSTQLRMLVAWMNALIDWLDDEDDDGDKGGGKPSLRPQPRRKKRGFENSR